MAKATSKAQKATGKQPSTSATKKRKRPSPYNAPTTQRRVQARLREMQILEMTVKGIPKTEIAEKLGISRQAVYSRLLSILNKLGKEHNAEQYRMLILRRWEMLYTRELNRYLTARNESIREKAFKRVAHILDQLARLGGVNAIIQDSAGAEDDRGSFELKYIAIRRMDKEVAQKLYDGPATMDEVDLPEPVKKLLLSGGQNGKNGSGNAQ